MRVLPGGANSALQNLTRMSSVAAGLLSSKFDY